MADIYGYRQVAKKAAITWNNLSRLIVPNRNECQLFLVLQLVTVAIGWAANCNCTYIILVIPPLHYNCLAFSLFEIKDCLNIQFV